MIPVGAERVGRREGWLGASCFWSVMESSRPNETWEDASRHGLPRDGLSGLKLAWAPLCGIPNSFSTANAFKAGCCLGQGDGHCLSPGASPSSSAATLHGLCVLRMDRWASFYVLEFPGSRSLTGTGIPRRLPLGEGFSGSTERPRCCFH